MMIVTSPHACGTLSPRHSLTKRHLLMERIAPLALPATLTRLSRLLALMRLPFCLPATAWSGRRAA